VTGEQLQVTGHWSTLVTVFRLLFTVVCFANSDGKQAQMQLFAPQRAAR